MNLEELKESLSTKLFGISLKDALSQGICLRCKKTPVHPTEQDRREYNLSGLCAPCWTEIMGREFNDDNPRG